MSATSMTGISGPSSGRASILRRGRVRLTTLGIAVLLLGLLAPPAAAVDTPIEVSPLSLDFGDVVVGSTSEMAVQVTNTGGSSFGPINIFGGAPPTAEFSASQNCQGQTLAAGASCQISYTFSPGAPGTFSDSSNLTISETPSQSDGENFSVALAGRGVSPAATHERIVTLRLRRHLVAKGRVVAVDGFVQCTTGVTVKIQRKRDGTWRTIDTTLTDTEGRYREPLPDRPGKYRAVVKRLELNGGADACMRARSPVVRNTVA